MVLQLSVGEIKYAPQRDIVYLYPDLIKTVADRLEEAAYPPLHELLVERGVSMDDLGEAVRCYCEYLNKAHQKPEQKMWDVLEESGWHACKPEAQIAVMFYTGVLLTGTFFKGIRDVVPLGGKAPPEVTDLLAAAKQLDAFISMPAWQRWLYRKFKWLRNIMLRGKGVRTCN